MWEVQGYYGKQYGWECVCAEDTREEALQRKKEYDENEPGYRHRIKEVKDAIHSHHEAG